DRRRMTEQLVRIQVHAAMKAVAVIEVAAANQHLRLLEIEQCPFANPCASGHRILVLSEPTHQSFRSTALTGIRMNSTIFCHEDAKHTKKKIISSSSCVLRGFVSSCRMTLLITGVLLKAVSDRTPVRVLTSPDPPTHLCKPPATLR